MSILAAIPSKRDLQTLIKAVQNELVNVVIEGELFEALHRHNGHVLSLLNYHRRHRINQISVSRRTENLSFNTIKSRRYDYQYPRLSDP